MFIHVFSSVACHFFVRNILTFFLPLGARHVVTDLTGRGCGRVFFLSLTVIVPFFSSSRSATPPLELASERRLRCLFHLSAFHDDNDFYSLEEACTLFSCLFPFFSFSSLRQFSGLSLCASIADELFFVPFLEPRLFELRTSSIGFSRFLARYVAFLVPV